MPRVPREPRYFASRGGYYVQLDNTQHLLAAGPEDDPEVKETAWRNFHALMATHNATRDGDRAQIQVVIELHLRWMKSNRAHNTFKQRRNFLQRFVEMHGDVAVCDLKVRHVEEWLEAGKEYRKNEKAKKWCRWGMSSRRIAISALVTCLRWAAKQGYITKNPLPDMERPPPVSRAGMCVVTDEMHRLLVERADRREGKGFRDFLTVLYETGARPGEIACIEARHYNRKKSCWVIEADPDREGQNKLAYRGKRRVIYLNDRLRRLVEGLNEEHPAGPTFPNEHGGFFNLDALETRFANFRTAINRGAEKKGLPRPITPGVSLYGYRHRYVTAWLEAGKPVGYLAELLGTSIKMIEHHYSHLAEHSESIRRALEDFSRGDVKP